MGAAAVALAIGLPFLFVEVRIASFYSYANAGFGYWMATRVLPGWATLAVVLGLVIGIRSANRHRSMASALGRAFLWSLGIATIATAISFPATASMRTSYFKRFGLPTPSLSHVLFVHLFDSQAAQKIQFDVCALSDNVSSSAGTAPLQFHYEFCIPDVDSLRKEVAAIDTTARPSAGSLGNGCGSGRILYIGYTGQPGAGFVLRSLCHLPYIRRISPSVIE